MTIGFLDDGTLCPHDNATEQLQAWHCPTGEAGLLNDMVALFRCTCGATVQKVRPLTEEDILNAG